MKAPPSTPDDLAAAQAWLAEVYRPRPGLVEGVRGLWRFVPACLAGGALWALLLWLIERWPR